jgi:DNA transformation protein
MARKKTTKTPGARSLKVSEGFKSFVLDQREELGDVTPRAMFGGVGLYFRGTFFGILARDKLYLKVGDANRADYARAGARGFEPYPDRGGTMKYCEVPLAILESPIDLVEWARKAIAVADSSPR